MDFPTSAGQGNLNTANKSPQPPSIIERMAQREEGAMRHSGTLDNFGCRLRRIENALGLDPMPENDMPQPPRQSFNY